MVSLVVEDVRAAFTVGSTLRIQGKVLSDYIGRPKIATF